MLFNTMTAAEKLAALGYDPRVLNVHTINPLDQPAIGGLGSAVAEVLMNRGVRPPLFTRFGLADEYVSVAGSQGYLRTRAGLDVDGLVRTILGCLRQETAGARR